MLKELRELIGHYFETNLLLQFLFRYITQSSFSYVNYVSRHVTDSIDAVNKILAEQGMTGSNIKVMQVEEGLLFERNLDYTNIASIQMIQELVTLIYEFSAEKVDFISKLNAFCYFIASKRRFLLIDVKTQTKVEMICVRDN